MKRRNSGISHISDITGHHIDIDLTLLGSAPKFPEPKTGLRQPRIRRRKNEILDASLPFFARVNDREMILGIEQCQCH